MIVDNTTEVKPVSGPLTPEMIDSTVEKVLNPSKPEDVLDTRSPEEIEAALLKEAEEAATQAAMNRDPAEIAAMMFHMFAPQFENMVRFLSNKELKRLLLAIVCRGHPNQPEVPTFKDPNAGKAFKLGLELQMAKFMMTQKLEIEALEKVQKEKEARELAAQSVITEERGEQIND